MWYCRAMRIKSTSAYSGVYESQTYVELRKPDTVHTQCFRIHNIPEQGKPVCSVKSQNSGYPWGISDRKGKSGSFSGAGNVLFLDLVPEYISMFCL